jgi:hypothetical protein
LKKTGQLKLHYFLQSAEADFVFVGAVSTARLVFVGAVSTARLIFSFPHATHFP